MRHGDIVPDWIIAVLAIFVAAIVYSLFGAIGLAAFGVTCVAVWIAQIIQGY
jgi:hypothetical protein